MVRLDGGTINAHTHLYSGLGFFGMPELDPPPRNFLDILTRRWWRLDRALDQDILRASARFYVAHALLAGTTVLVDHHESPQCIAGSLDVLADVCQELGMRAVVCYGITERNRGEDEANEGLAENQRFLETNNRPLVRGAVGMHASFTLDDASIRRAGALAQRFRVPVHVHVAEDLADVEDARRRGFSGPLERLRALDALPPGALLAHGIHLSATNVHQDVPAMGAWIIQNPRSNEGNAVGYGRPFGMHDRVALGTDGFPSKMADEFAALRRIARHEEDANAEGLPAARQGASVRLAKELFGARADDFVEWEETPQDSRPQRVVIAGREVVCRGELLTGDLQAIHKEAEEAAKRLFARMNAMGDAS